jgi:hypothetical protein
MQRRLRIQNIFEMDSELPMQLAKFWEIETLGLDEDPNSQNYTIDEQAALDLMQKNICYDPSLCEYSTRLPWKLNPEENLDSNLPTAMAVFSKKIKKAIKDGQYENCCSAYDEMVNNDFCAAIPPAEIRNCQHAIHYIPNQPVYKPDRLTTKVRIVMNASATCRSTRLSLNDCLYIGPSLLPDLVHVLLRFRIRKYVAIMDVSKMFFRIRINEPDNDVLRFIWQWQNDASPVHMRMKSLTFGLNSAPFIAIWTVHEHCRRFEKSFPLAAPEVTENTYMDDCPTGDNVREKCIDRKSVV